MIHTPIHVYVLVGANEKLVSPIHPMWTASKVTVRPGASWYAARAECVQRAIDDGHKHFAIFVGTCRLHIRLHNQPLLPAGLYDYHYLWIAMTGTLERFASHVYVKPLAWAKNKNAEHGSCVPVIPMVAAYRTAAVATLKDLEAPWGYELCKNGYESWTEVPFFYENLSQPKLEEVGSTTSWRGAYKRAINSLLE